MSTTKQRIVREAVRLFAERGFDGTSVADIQKASGLTGGSGAMYKHFKSKGDVLEAVGLHHVREIEAYMDRLGDRTGDDLFGQLVRAGDLVWEGLVDNHELLRVMYRDLEKSTAALDMLWTVINDRIFSDFTEIIERGTRIGVFTADRPDQVSLILVSALLYIPTADALTDHRPARFSTDAEYKRAWIETAERVLQPSSDARP